MDFIGKLGKFGIQLGSLVGTPSATQSYVIDWPAVLPTQFWIVDSASLLYQSGTTPAPVDPAFSGLFIVQGTSVLQEGNNPQMAGQADVSNRGIKLATEFEETAFALVTVTSFALRKSAVIPPNYKLRAVVLLNNGSQPDADLPFGAQAGVRIFDIGDCEALNVKVC